MFITRKRSIVIPQAEHARLSGAIAYAWGNKNFNQPAIPFERFVAAVTMHDRGYGELDNDGIGEMSSERWLEIQRRSASQSSSDTVIDTVVLKQLRRISTYSKSPEKDRFISEISAQIEQLINESGFSDEEFEFVDRITNLCDNISFDFCHELPTTGTVKVSQQLQSPSPTTVSYKVKERGLIQIEPWPLNVSQLSGHIIGFTREGYPVKLKPITIPYLIKPYE